MAGRKVVVYVYLVAAVILACAVQANSSNLKIHCIDVGQGSSELVIGPDGTSILIDGGTSSKGYSEVVPYLDAIFPPGSRHLDYVVASHDDNDHYGGLNSVLSSGYTAGTIYHCGSNSGFGRGVQIPLGLVIDLGSGARATCVGRYGQFIDGSSGSTSDNEQSICLLIEYGVFDYITAGDLESNENYLSNALISYPPADPYLDPDHGVDVIHVNHHGSNNSSNNYYVNRLKHELAVINGGEGYTYGHPRWTVVDRLKGRVYYSEGGGATGVTWTGCTNVYRTTYDIEEYGRAPEWDCPTLGDMVVTYDGVSTNYYFEGTPYPVDEDVPSITPHCPWPMFRNDVAHTGKSSTTGPTEPALYWSYGTALNVSASPALSAIATVYISSEDNYLYTIDSAGALLWSYEAAGPIVSSAAIGTATVYIGSDDNMVYCLRQDGAFEWSYETAGVVSSSPTLTETYAVYIGSEDNYFYSIDSAGSLLWSYETADPILSSAAVGTDTVYIGSDDNMVYCLGYDGALSWSYETVLNVSASPTLSPTETLYIGSEDNVLYTIDSAGALLWSYETGDPIFSSVAISTDTVYVGSDDNMVYCLWQDGAFEWSYETAGDISASPAVSATDTVYIGSEDNYLYAIGSDGALMWSYETGDPIFSSVAISTDTVYVGSDDYRLHVISVPMPTDTTTVTPTRTETPTITPTLTPPAPTATPTPILEIVPSDLTAGQSFQYTITLRGSINELFDFYVLADTQFGPYTLYLDGKVEKGIKALYRNAPGRKAPLEFVVIPNKILPLTMGGKEVTFYAVVVEAGTIPPIQSPSELTPQTENVILMDKKTVTVAP